MLPFRYRWLLLPLILSLSGLLLWVVWAHWEGERPSLSISQKEALSSNPVEIRDFGLQEFQSGSLDVRVRAEVFKIQSRKFGLFSIRPIREAALLHPQVELFLPEEGPLTKIDLFPFFSTGQEGAQRRQDFPFPKEVGLITRVVMKDLDIRIHRKGGQPLSVTAGEAILDMLNKNIRMKEVVVEDEGAHRSIRGPVAVWLGNEKRFYFPRDYILKTGAGETRGKDIHFDLAL